MKSAILANDIVIADLEITRLAFELHVLRLTADHGMFEDAISGSEARVLLDDGIGPNLAIWPDFHVIFDDDVWANNRVGIDLGGRADDSC